MIFFEFKEIDKESQNLSIDKIVQKLTKEKNSSLISEIEKIVAFRYLKPKRKEGFLKIISIFSFLGIALGVAVY